jgi:hypothetical protein
MTVTFVIVPYKMALRKDQSLDARYRLPRPALRTIAPLPDGKKKRI